MELQLVKKGFDYARKRKKWIFILGAVGVAGYGTYRFYKAPSVARKRKRLFKLMGALLSVAEAVTESAETVGLVSRDVKEFLQSDSDQVPNSLRQISKIACSQHFSDSLISVTRAVTEGVLRGYQSVNGDDQTVSDSPLVDRMLDKLLTPAGSGFASVVVGSFARNLVIGFYSDVGHSGVGGELNSSNGNGAVSSNSDHVPTWVDVVCGDKYAELIGNCVQLFVSTAVAVYLDKTMHINPYDDFFSGLTDSKHETKVKDMLVSVCNGAVETLVKTSHYVLTSSNPNVSSSTGPCLANGEGTSPNLARIEELGVETLSEESKAGDVSSSDENENESGWVSKVSSTLAVPSNRMLVLDVTGRVTFETVKSVMEFLLHTFCASVRRCAEIIHDAVLEIVRYIAAKSSVIVTICLYLCLHIMGGSWALLPG